MTRGEIIEQIDDINSSLIETTVQRQRIANYLLKADKDDFDYMLAKNQEDSLDMYRFVLKTRRAYLSDALGKVK